MIFYHVFSLVRSTSENSDVFNSRDETYLVIYQKKLILFLFYTFYLATCNVSPTEKGGAENAKTKNISKSK